MEQPEKAFLLLSHMNPLARLSINPDLSSDSFKHENHCLRWYVPESAEIKPHIHAIAFIILIKKNNYIRYL